jgi:hypothetical protein
MKILERDVKLQVINQSTKGPPHSVASYDTHGDVENLFYPGIIMGYEHIESLALLKMLRFVLQVAISH